ncbi:MAG: NAD-dependent epimerase/dehydratase family protein, partial [Eubacteriales bacterium]
DNLNNFYDVQIKNDRLDDLNQFDSFSFLKGDISDENFVQEIFAKNKPDIVINLAAQAGVQYSMENPASYIKSNIAGFYSILEACKSFKPRHLVYASSSSVYGSNRKVPFEETDPTDNPVSFYAATKKSDELMAHTYSHLYHIPATGLRFFTVYGPMGRPDMAYFKFTRSYFAGEPIQIYNKDSFGNELYRDFTYIDDIVDGTLRILGLIPEGDTPHRIFNIGNNRPQKLMYFIETLEKALSRAIGSQVIFNKVFAPMQPGDVPATYACIDKLKRAVDFEPRTTIEEGLQKFADWYVNYYKI